MKLSLKNPTPPFTFLPSTDLPPFTVLTGLNGSGKTALLRAIKKGDVTVDNLATGYIRMSESTKFFPEISTQTQTETHNSEWLSEATTALDSIKRRMTEFLAGHSRCELEEISAKAIECDLPIHSLLSFDVLSDQQRTLVSDYLTQLRLTYKIPDNAALSLLEPYLQLSRKFVFDISEDDLKVLHVNKASHKGFGTIAFAEWISAYLAKYEENSQNGYYQSQGDPRGEHLSAENFIQRYGKEPWVIINSFLEQFGESRFRVNEPVRPFSRNRYNFEFVDKENSSTRIQFDNMSSGEKILLGLAFFVFSSKGRIALPKLLLLDEVDAGLHPSMTLKLLSVIRDQFVANGVNVIMATHSPTTVYYANEDEVYQIDCRSNQPLQKCGRARALELMTENIMTLDKGLRILDSIQEDQLAIISEGRNTDYLRLALKFENVENVHFVSGIEDRTGKGDLRRLFELFSRVGRRSRVLFVWDCDALTEVRRLNETSSVKAFCFEQNLSNTLMTKGIENLFPSDCFAEFLEQRGNGNNPIFPKDKKNAFQDAILRRNRPEDFMNFRPFVEKVRQIMEQSSA